MKIKLRYKDHRETARILELASDSSTLVPTHGDDVFLDGSLFTVQNRTFDYDNHTCTVTIVRDGRTTEQIRRQQGETTPKGRSPSGFLD
jgi:hypothetical protein